MAAPTVPTMAITYTAGAGILESGKIREEINITFRCLQRCKSLKMDRTTNRTWRSSPRTMCEGCETSTSLMTNDGHCREYPGLTVNWDGPVCRITDNPTFVDALLPNTHLVVHSNSTDCRRWFSKTGYVPDIKET